MEGSINIEVGEISETYDINGDELRITPLGAGCEVGRSCILVEFNDRKIMFDCGIHPGFSGIGALPIFDAIDTSKVDLCLVTHFHLDHCGALPYFVSKTQFKGKILMTEPTRAISKLFWNDYASLASNRGHGYKSSAQDTEYVTDDSVFLFDGSDICKCLSLCEIIDFRQTLEYKELGIKVTCYAAGHVLGACMFCVEIDRIRILYTGDFSREQDRHVPIAEKPDLSVHVLICESTYGIRVHEPRLQREQRFIQSVLNIINRGGKCLIPIFALGRAQELLLILEEYWKLHPKLHSVPIWYCSTMSFKSMLFFETFISSCGEYVKSSVDQGTNPFYFQFVKNAKNINDMKYDVYNEGTPCIIIASPGMLQSGTSRTIFKTWCHDPRNGVILTGYTIKGTLIDDLKKNSQAIQLQPGGPLVPILSSFEMISFSAHSDFEQTFDFIEKLKPQIVVLVHGERSEMSRLNEKLKELRPNLAIFSPEILQTVSLRFPPNTKAIIVGSLIDKLIDKDKTCNSPIDAIVLLPSKASSDPLSDMIANSVCFLLMNYVTQDKKTQMDNKQKKENQIDETLIDENSIEETLMDENTIEETLTDETLIEKKSVDEHVVDETSTDEHRIERTQTEEKPMEDIQNEELRIPITNPPVEPEELVDILILALRTKFPDITTETDINNNVTATLEMYNYDTDTFEEVIVHFDTREIKGSNESCNDVIRQFLRKIENALLPIPVFI